MKMSIQNIIPLYLRQHLPALLSLLRLQGLEIVAPGYSAALLDCLSLEPLIDCQSRTLIVNYCVIVNHIFNDCQSLNMCSLLLHGPFLKI